MPIGSFLELSEKRKYYVNCLVDLQNFIRQHSESFAYEKFLSKKVQGNINLLLEGILIDIDNFVEYADLCDVWVSDDGKSLELRV